MLKFLRFNIGGFFKGYDEIRLWNYKHSAKYEILYMNFGRVAESQFYEKKRIPISNPERLSEWDALDVNSWANEYYQCACDGTQWRLAYREDGKKTRIINGSNAYPPQWNQFIEWLDALMPEMHFSEELEEEEIDEDDN